ncbi:peptidoglycan DD-metalloendopeptidase family protein [Lysinibacillus sp. UGB7]|uniref:peptidoglycan DD-metalloendopeptidase family protein n=1 Tax=Lysinibacillus sp. UGB7 TaxID=3411039 RepID=UPI003B78D3B0
MSGYNNNEEQNELSDDLKDIGKQTGRKVGQAAGNKVKGFLRKQGGKAAAKALKAVGSALMKIIAALTAKIGIVIAVVLAVIALIALCWIIIRELDGAEGSYVNDSPSLNDFEEGEKNGYKYMKQKGLTGYNKTLYSYYDSVTNNNYWIIDPTDPEQPDISKYDAADEDIPLYKMETPQTNTEIRDYYRREGDLVTNANLLYTMETYLHKEKFYFTQQFTKPVHYNPVTMNIQPLTELEDESKKLVVESREWDEEKEEFMEDKKIKSVHDWGLATVFKYKEDEIEKKIEGTYTAEDYYDAGCDCVQQKSINEPFEEMMEGYPVDIWLIDQSVTIAGGQQHVYKREKTVMGSISDGSSSNPKDPVNKILAGTYDVYKTEEYETTNEEGETVTETREVFDRTVELYKHRTGDIVEIKPVPDEEKEKEELEKMKKQYKELYGEEFDESRYSIDYAEFYATYYPDDVDTKLKFTEGALNSYGANIPMGAGVNSSKYQKAIQYLPLAIKIGNKLGVDPYLIIAMVTQESGGNANTSNGGGLMQVHNLLSFTNTVNTTDVSGKPISCSLTLGEASNPEKNMYFGSCYLKTKLEKYNGNVYKTVQSYNFDVSGFMERNYPEKWADEVNNSWMDHIEEARSYYAQKETGHSDSYSASYDCIPGQSKTGSIMYGDSCYVSHVMQYYGNPNASDGAVVANADGSAPTITPGEGDEGGGILDGITGAITGAFKWAWEKVKGSEFGMEVYDYDPEQPHTWYEAKIPNSSLEEIFTLTEAYNQIVPMGEVDYSMDDKEFYLNKSNSRSTVGGVAGTGGNTVSGENITGIPSGAEGLILPINHPNPKSLITSGYGQRWGALHAGIDFGIPTGTPLYAMGGGVVERVVNHCPKEGSLSGTGTCGSGILEWGNHVKLVLPNGDYIIYGHMDAVAVTQGSKVVQGQFLGVSGGSGFSSGPHLHLEYRVGGKPINPAFILK